MTTTTPQIQIYSPLVGAHYRPPARAILQVLPIGTPLWIIPEPHNEHDANALQVIVKSADIPPAMHEALATQVEGFGFTMEEILSQDSWHLGYVARAHAAHLCSHIGGKPCQVKLTFDLDGKPLVEGQTEPAGITGS